MKAGKMMFLILMMGVIPLFSQDIDISKLPGYIDLSEIKVPGQSDDVTEISLGPALLNLASQFENGDKELSEALRGLVSIQVKNFVIDENESKKIIPIIKKYEMKMKKENWQNLVSVKKAEDIANISVKTMDGKVQGLFIMTFEPNHEVNFVNIVGDIDFDHIAKIASEFNDSPAMDSLKTKLKEIDQQK